MKKFYYLLVAGYLFFLFYSCIEEASPRDQLLSSIKTHASFNKSVNQYILKNNSLCNMLNCSSELITDNETNIYIYSKEDLFMRGVNSFWIMNPNGELNHSSENRIRK